jgi:hypothetical protein
MPQQDNLEVTLHRLEEEVKWSQEKIRAFVEWLTDADYIKPGQRTKSRVVENLFEKIQTFESGYTETQ